MYCDKTTEGIDNQVISDDEPKASQSNHKVEIKLVCYDRRGTIYAVLHEGEALIDRSYDPEFQACRELLRRGLRGKLTTYRDGKASMVLDVEKAAQHHTKDNDQGTPTIRILSRIK